MDYLLLFWTTYGKNSEISIGSENDTQVVNWACAGLYFADAERSMAAAFDIKF